MSLRFKLGEQAKFVVAICEVENKILDKECFIEAVGPFKRGDLVKFSQLPSGVVATEDFDYLAVFPNDHILAGIQHDWQLQKKNPLAEPESLKHTSDIEEEITA